MTAFLNSLLSVENITRNDFNLGYLAGAGVVIAALLLLLLIKVLFTFIFRTRRCSGIMIKEQGGGTFVSKNAVATLISSLEKEFKFITISKQMLYSRGKVQTLKLHVDFNADGGGLPPQASELRARIRELLKQTFGIDSVKDIIVIIRNVSLSVLPKPQKPAEQQPEADKPEDKTPETADEIKADSPEVEPVVFTPGKE